MNNADGLPLQKNACFAAKAEVLDVLKKAILSHFDADFCRADIG